MPEYIEPMKPIIEIVTGQMRTSIEGELYRAVQNVGINVDKDRLLQALNDARSFYAEGYRAGQEATDMVAVVHASWEYIVACAEGYCYGHCSNCKTQHKAANPTALKMEYRHCRWCGARMDGDSDA